MTITKRSSLSAASGLALIAGLMATSVAPAHAAVADEPEITYTLNKVANPTAAEQDAYNRITVAMDAAVGRYNALSDLDKDLLVSYVPSVQTADGNYNGSIRFGSNTSFMTERTALHEIAHTVGIGQTNNFTALSAGGTWNGPTANALIRTFDGPDARISVGGGHIWPYGLNYENEWNNEAANRHVQIIDAMVDDGM